MKINKDTILHFKENLLQRQFVTLTSDAGVQEEIKKVVFDDEKLSPIDAMMKLQSDGWEIINNKKPVKMLKRVKHFDNVVLRKTTSFYNISVCLKQDQTWDVIDITFNGEGPVVTMQIRDNEFTKGVIHVEALHQLEGNIKSVFDVERRVYAEVDPTLKKLKRLEEVIYTEIERALKDNNLQWEVVKDESLTLEHINNMDIAFKAPPTVKKYSFIKLNFNVDYASRDISKIIDNLHLVEEADAILQRYPHGDIGYVDAER
ncbi:MAG: hypothetical protein MJZ34_02235 [Paludibacteraceae bacterium]|nr:hypothetical protein [Paludibacteraceae bacterium]